jgi:hypothetical protein
MHDWCHTRKSLWSRRVLARNRASCDADRRAELQNARLRSLSPVRRGLAVRSPLHARTGRTDENCAVTDSPQRGFPPLLLAKRSFAQAGFAKSFCFDQAGDQRIDAIARGDATAAERALQLNWENGAARLAQVVDRLGERGSWL